MHKACPRGELARGEVLRLDTALLTVFHTEDGEIFAIDDTRTHTKMPHWLTATWRTTGLSGYFTHPGSASVQEAWTNRRPTRRSGLTKCKSSMATSWSSTRTKPPTFRPE